MNRWLAVYDTPSDGRRRRLVRILEGYGDRVQESVFEVCGEEAHITRMLTRLERVVDPDEDNLRLYPVCAACAQKVLVVCGEGPEPWEVVEVLIV